MPTTGSRSSPKKANSWRRSASASATKKPNTRSARPACKAGVAGSGNGQFSAPRGIAVAANGDVWVVDDSNNRVEEFNEKDEYISKFGSTGAGNGQLDEPKGVAVAASGNVMVTDSVNDRVQEFTPSGTFVTTFGDKGTGNGQFEEPWGIAVASNGDIYVADVKNNRVQEWTPAPRPGNDGADDTHTVYYTAKGESEVAACQNHPEWAGLVCQTEPTVQPGDSGAPPLPVTTVTYNTWDDPETVTEQIGSVTRTTKKTYDSCGARKGKRRDLDVLRKRGSTSGHRRIQLGNRGAGQAERDAGRQSQDDHERLQHARRSSRPTQTRRAARRNTPTTLTAVWKK